MKSEPIPYTLEPTLQPQGKVVIRLTETTWLEDNNVTNSFGICETRDHELADRFDSTERAQGCLDSIGGLKRWGDARLEVVGA